MTFQGLRAVANFVSSEDQGVYWSATTKPIPELTYAITSELFKGGCRTLEMGIESIHNNYQRLLCKVQPFKTIESVISAILEAGITTVLNLIYGFPQQKEDTAIKQLEWFLKWKKKYPSLVYGSHNMLEVNEGSLLSIYPKRFAIEMKELGHWAFSYTWNAPSWRPNFLEEMNQLLSKEEYTD